MDTKFFEMIKMMEAMNMQNGFQGSGDESFENMMHVFELKSALDNCECALDVLFVIRDYLPPAQQRSIDLLVKFMEIKELLNSDNTRFGTE